MNLFPTFDRNWGRFAKASKVFECKLCEMRTEEEEEIKDHYNEKHKEPTMTEVKKEASENEEASEGSKDKPTCEERQEMKDQYDEKHKEPTKPSATEEVPSKSAKESKPNTFDLARDVNILFRCLACNEIMRHKHQHRKRHDRNRQPMVCHLCGKILCSLETYQIHMRMHKAKEEGVKILCKVCGKSFPVKASLKSHMRFHSKARPHICETCGKGFKTQYHLYRHALIHVPVKPLICSYCGKGFNNESNLKGHIRIHTGEKPYKCDLCPAAFTHNVSLKSHKKSAHGVDMWKLPPVKVSIEVEDDILKSSAGIEKTDGGSDAVVKTESTNEQARVVTELIPQQQPPSSISSVIHGSSPGNQPVAGTDTVAARGQEVDNKGIHFASHDIRSDRPSPVSYSHPGVILPRGDQPIPVTRHPNPPVQQPNPLVQQPNPPVQQPNPLVQYPNPSTQQPNPLVQHPYPAMLPHHQAAPSEFITPPVPHRAPPYNMSDSLPGAQDFLEAARRTFTKL